MSDNYYESDIRKQPIGSEILSEFLESLDEAEQEEHFPEPIRKQEDSKPSFGAHIPPIIEKVLSGSHVEYFTKMADWFHAATSNRKKEVSVLTSIGEVKFSVIEWIELPGFVKIIVDSNCMPFSPSPMSQMTLLHRGKAYHVTCVSSLIPMFGDLPFSEMIMVLNSPEEKIMEKNARTKDQGAPSVVSGRPSINTVHGEPTAEGEEASDVTKVLNATDYDRTRS